MPDATSATRRSRLSSSSASSTVLQRYLQVTHSLRRRLPSVRMTKLSAWQRGQFIQRQRRGVLNRAKARTGSQSSPSQRPASGSATHLWRTNAEEGRRSNCTASHPQTLTPQAQREEARLPHRCARVSAYRLAAKLRWGAPNSDGALLEPVGLMVMPLRGGRSQRLATRVRCRLISCGCSSDQVCRGLPTTSPRHRSRRQHLSLACHAYRHIAWDSAREPHSGPLHCCRQPEKPQKSGGLIGQPLRADTKTTRSWERRGPDTEDLLPSGASNGIKPSDFSGFSGCGNRNGRGAFGPRACQGGHGALPRGARGPASEGGTLDAAIAWTSSAT